MAAVMDTRTKYRVGSPILPTLPVNSKPLSFSAKLHWATHLERIGDILDRNKITDRSTNVEYRFHTECHDKDKYITIRTQAKYEAESDITWPRAVQQIQEYLNHENLHPAIEILAPALEGRRTYPVETDVFQWNKVLLPDVHNIINSYDTQWIAIDMVYREDVEVTGMKRPTILISARDADEQYWWDDILPAVRHRVAQFPNIQVELLYCYELIPAAANAALPQESTNDADVDSPQGHDDAANAGPPQEPSKDDDTILREFDDSADIVLLEKCLKSQTIPLGASCGRRGGGTGSLGGTLRLRKPDSTEFRVGITNHHVIFGYDICGGPITKFLDPINVESPSKADRTAYEKRLSNYSSYYTEKGTQLSDEAKENKKGTADMVARIKSFDAKVGEVFASSGFRSVQDNNHDEAWSMDWCLIKIEGRPSSSTFDSFELGIKDITGYCSIDPCRAYHVVKQGRTTGSTPGYISATESVIRSRVPDPEDGITKARKDPTDPPVRCHSMISDTKPIWNKDFLRPGDSGSLILLDPQNLGTLDDEGKTGSTSTSAETTAQVHKHEALIAGLAFANNPSSLLSYMMPIDMVIKDIESATGCTVVEPKYSGLVKHPPPPPPRAT
ncbi:hypothetical protein K505DRAFT_418517 [Melanomma pulvis-pyrius CBS 109.77]|uniref:Uncharacterized protein n=1 Tax=Melanomma pulvis-pyrius CBS 109.77 TaxID=1314802 RepID=A0A6A6X7J5_9PLEO|nr:hypothetical protein K505DRAFT_418517 [Melanomma pulvis-pyrius CBS 109.77]